jgi:hypothetical protein
MKELKETQQETDLETNMRKMPELQTDLEKPDILTFKTIKNDDERGRKVTSVNGTKVQARSVAEIERRERRQL